MDLGKTIGTEQRRPSPQQHDSPSSSPPLHHAMNAWQSHTAAGIFYVGVASTVMAAFLVVGTCVGGEEGRAGREGGRRVPQARVSEWDW